MQSFRAALFGSVFLSLLAFPAQAKPPAAATTPQAIVDWVYAQAIKPLKGEKSPQGGGFLLDAAEMKADFSAAFVKAWTTAHAKAKEDDGPIIDFDPATNSQDPDFARYRTSVEKTSDTTATIAANMWTKTGKVPTIVRYDFVKEGNVWKIDDIRGTVEKDPWSIRKLLDMAIEDFKKR